MLFFLFVVVLAGGSGAAAAVVVVVVITRGRLERSVEANTEQSMAAIPKLYLSLFNSIRYIYEWMVTCVRWEGGRESGELRINT